MGLEERCARPPFRVTSSEGASESSSDALTWGGVGAYVALLLSPLRLRRVKR
jgi:hypothetical protein